MAADSALTIIIRARDDASKTFKGMSRDFKQAADAMGDLGSKMTMGITLPVLGIGGAMTKLAMDAVESENLFDVSMKGMAESARQWSNEMSKALGLNAYEVRRNVGVFNNMFSSMGLGEKSALDMSEGMTQLAYDMASFFNLNPDQAFEKLRAGIMGEAEPLKALGIVISETTVKQWALNNGLIQQGQEMSEAQKVLARYGLIMQSTADAQGDLARTADSPANALRRMRSQMEEIGISAGQVFLPEISKALAWVNNEGIPKVQAALDGFKQSWADMSDEGRNQILQVAGMLVAGGPLLMGLSTAFKAIVALSVAFKTLRIKAIAEIGLILAAGIALGYTMDTIWNEHRLPTLEGTLDAVGRTLGGMNDFLGGMIKNVTGVESLDGALKQLGLDGVASFDDIAKTMNRTVVAMPAMDDLWASWQQSGKAGPPSMDDLTANYEAVNDVIIRASASLTAQKPALDIVKAGWDSVGGAGAKAGEDLAKAAEQARQSAAGLMASTSQVVAYLVSIHPASIAAAAGVASLKAQISDIQGAIAANNDALHSMQGALAGLQEQASAVSEALSEAKARLSELANIRLPGMNAMEDQMFRVEQQIKRLKLAELGMDVGEFGPLAGDLPQTVDELEKMLEAMRLQKSLRYDEQLRQIKQAASGIPEEMPFAQAMAEIASTKGNISGLEGSLAGIQGAIKGVQGAMAGLQENNYQLNKTLSGLQEELQGAEGKQQSVNKALETAYGWIIEQRPELVKLGAEWMLQVGLIDEETRRLIDVTTIYATEQSKAATAAIDAALRAYEDARTRMAAPLYVGASPVAPPSGGVPTLTPEDTVAGSSMAVQRAGGYTPVRQLTAGTPASQIVNIYVTVEGSVVTERELAEAVRRELIKTGRRNGAVLGGLG